MRTILLCLAILSAFSDVYAQKLNEHCVVAVLNRTAQVRADGSWDLPNVPAGFGAVRARATCVEGGKTFSGQSEPFMIQANRMNAIPQIVLGPTTPIPTHLTLSASTKTLTQAGQTVQVNVTGIYADGSNQNLSNAVAGTQYLVSNDQIATVSVDGLVTAMQSGTVLIQAVNEGAQGLLQLSIALSADSDGDGILDDIEIREGLDPANPADALDDPDRDGLSNKDELQRGTNLHNADTDGDGLLDGEEVKLGSNPLLQDTDGDGVPDNIEAATGSDPLNAASFDLAKALKQIKVAPAYFVINVNSIDPVAFQQLKVTGEFKLGGTIDLTARSRGTDYATSNAQICNFGAENGRVYGGSNGSCIVTVSNSGFTATARGNVQTFTPRALSYVSIPGFANNVEVSGNFAYVASGSTGLQVVDVSDKTAPKVVASLDTPGNGNDVAVVSIYAYLADDAFGVRIIDISNPLAPVLIGVYDTPGVAWDVTVRGGYAYVADGSSGLLILDVSNPAAPSYVGSLTLPGVAKGVDVDLERRLAVVAAGTGGFHVVNIQDTATPALLASIAGGDVRDVAVDGDYAFLADYARSFTVADISNPIAPLLGASTASSTGGLLQDVLVSGHFALGADVYFVNGIPIIDTGLPASPQPRAILNFAGYRDDNGTGIAADASYVYLTAERGISENGVIGDTRLYIGQYRALDDPGVAPTVSISAPSQGDTVIQGTQLAISAQASDDVAVAAVIFAVNGTDVFTDTTAPYETTFAVPSDAGNLAISAEAIDLAGNQASSVPVNVIAIPDPLTTAVGRVVDRNGTALAGAKVTCLEYEASTGADGTFSVPGLPTIQGDIRCSASLNEENRQLTGVSDAVAPVRGAATNIGDIIALEMSSQGRDFWLTHHAVSSGTQLIILSDVSTNFTISSNNYSYTGSVSPQSPAVVPVGLVLASNQVVENKGMHITSDADVTVLLFISGSFTADVALVIPRQSLGREYFAVGYTGWYSSYYSELAIVASQNDTHVTIVPVCNSRSGTAAGSVLNIVLHAGQTYQYQCSSYTDVTGTRISSDKAIGVVSGNSCAQVPVGTTACDVLSEMMLPVDGLYGTEFFSAPLPGGAADLFRIMAAYDGTSVTVDQGGGTQNIYQLDAGRFQELRIEPGTHFTSNKPVSVTQYAVGYSQAGIGDPFQMQLIPTKLYKNSYRFYTPSGFNQGTYALIIAPTSALSSVLLNGLPVTGFRALPGGTHQYAVVFVPNGQSIVSASQPIAVYAVGFAYGLSYGYPAGF